MKKTFLVFALLIATLNLGVLAKNNNLELKYGIRKYKLGNYLNCIQRMEALTKKDPSNALAHYYLAISNARIGNKDVAIAEYNVVKQLDSSFLLSLYADKGIKCLENPDKCEGVFLNEDMTEDIGPAKGVSNYEATKALEKQQKLRKIKQLLNSGQEVPKEDMKLFKDLTPKKKSKIDTPSDAEIANAVKTLAKIGINPLAMNSMGSNPYAMNSMGSNPYAMNGMNSKNMEMQMLMSTLNPKSNNNSYGSMNSMMPFMMMNQGSDKASPELMQSMMTNMLMPDMGSFGNTSNN